MLVVVMVVLVVFWAVLLLALWFRLRFGIWLGCGDRLEVEEDLVPEVSGDRCRAGGFPGLLPECWGCPRGGWGGSGSLVRGCGFAFGRGLVDEVRGEGRGGGGGR